MTVPEPTPTTPSSKAALRELAVVVVVFAALWWIPYLHPVMEDYRYWDRIDASPLLRAVTLTPPPKAQAAAGPPHLTAASGSEDKLSEAEEQQAIAALDETVTVKEPALPPPSTDTHQVNPLPAAATSAGAAALPRSATQSSTAALHISDATVGALKAKLEGAQALRPFWRALVALAEDPKRLVRIRHYGDSHLANDGISLVLRTLLQRRFGDGGHGFSAASARTKWYRRKGVKWSSNDAWKTKTYLGGGQSDRAYGYGGVVSLGRAGAQVRLQTTKAGVGSRVNRLALYWRGVAKGQLSVQIDGKREQLALSSDGQDHHKVWRLPDGPHKVKLRVVKGRVKLYGVGFERDHGLIYDSLGVTGARARRWLKVDGAHLNAQYKQRPVELIVINYGGNSRGDRITGAKYRKSFGEVIDLLRGESRPACLVLSPTDHGVRKRGKVISDPKTIRLVKWQRQVAKERGCAFLDGRALMGGDGAMGRWVKRGLGWGDYSHLTAKGQRRLGRDIYGALMQGLREHLRSERP